MATFRAAAEASEDGVADATIVIAKPTGVVSGDVLIAPVSGFAASLTWSSSGWTVLQDATSASWNQSMAVLWKVAGGSEPADYTFTASGTVNDKAGIIVAYHSAAASDQINVSGEQLDDSGQSSPFDVTAPSVTTTVANTRLVWLGFALPDNTAATTFAVPSGYTSRENIQGGSGWVRIAVGDILQVSAGASGAATAAWTVSGAQAARYGVHVAIAPAAGGAATVRKLLLLGVG